MATNPFVVAPLPKGNLFQRALGKRPREHAFVHVQNILATTPLHEVAESEIATALAGAQLLPRDATQELLPIFERAVTWLAADKELSVADRAGLAALQRAFELTDAEAAIAVEAVVGQVFEVAMRRALSDGTFTAEEKAQLEATATALGMSEVQTKRLYGVAATAAVQSAFDAAVNDRRYSTDEEAKVNELAHSLGVTIQHGTDTKRIVERFRLLGRIDEGELPVITPGILLQRGESCHWSGPATHKELRTVTKRINYSGPSASIKIMKGVRWRVGSVSVQRVSSEVMTEIDRGTLYITSKRLLFDGAKKNTSIAIGKISNFTAFSDGIQIEKGSGRDAYFVGEGDWELAGAVLNGAYIRS